MARPRTKPIPYSIPTLCACGCGQYLYNPDDHYRYRKFLPDHYDNKGDKHPRFGKKEEFEHLEMRVDAIKKTLKALPPTSIEKELFEFLDARMIPFVRQARLGTTIVDAYIPSMNLAVFADGVYWHSKPEVKERDERHVKMLKERGYKVLRLKSINYGNDLDLEPLKAILATS